MYVIIDERWHEQFYSRALRLVKATLIDPRTISYEVICAAYYGEAPFKSSSIHISRAMQEIKTCAEKYGLDINKLRIVECGAFSEPCYDALLKTVLKEFAKAIETAVKQ